MKIFYTVHNRPDKDGDVKMIVEGEDAISTVELYRHTTGAYEIQLGYWKELDCTIDKIEEE